MDPKDFKYTEEHEWVYLESGDEGKVGITQYAQSQLGDIVFLAMPKIGAKVKQFQKLGEIESVKAVSDLFSPVSGEVIESNPALADAPQRVNEDPYNSGWLVRIKLSDPAELKNLMTADVYNKLVTKLSKPAA